MTTLEVKPDGLIYLVKDCPEEPTLCPRMTSMCTSTWERCSCEVYHRALAEAKKNSIPFDLQQAKDFLSKEYFFQAYTPDRFLKPGIYPIPDQYKVEIKRGNICINCGEPDCVSLLCYDGVDGHCGYERVAVLSPLKPEEDLDEMFKEWIGEKPQEDKLISEPKDIEQ